MTRLKKIRLHEGLCEPDKPPIDVYKHIEAIEYLATHPTLLEALHRLKMNEILLAIDIIEYYNIGTNTDWYKSFINDINTFLGTKYDHL